MYFPDAGMTTNDRVDLMTNRAENDALTNRMTANTDHKVKPEYEYGSLPRQFNSTSISTDRSRCGPFDGKPTSNGYYPNMLSQSGVNFSGVV
jgi:meiosis-specific transcription factor NDT80